MRFRLLLEASLAAFVGPLVDGSIAQGCDHYLCKPTPSFLRTLRWLIDCIHGYHFSRSSGHRKRNNFL